MILKRKKIIRNARGFFYFVIIFITCNVSFAQSGLLNTNPPSLKWYKIKSPHFTIYFDKKINEEGNYVANLLNSLYRPVSYSLKTQPGRIPVILQNQTVFSNGFFSETPLRSEFFLYPPQDYNVDGIMRWENLLSIHEFRHVVQYNKSLTGFNRLAYLVFGSEASGTLSHLAVPDWFWEGDAVLTETSLTSAGRGRDPYFSVLMRTNMLERGPFNYYLQYLRSFRYNIPDHYVTGYYLTSYIRRKYGAEAVSQVLNKTWSWPFIPFRFSHELKKITGNNLVHNYNAMTRDIDSIWHDHLKTIEIQKVETITVRSNDLFTDYMYPAVISEGGYVALKSGIDDIASFVKIDSAGNEKKLFTPGLMDLTGYPTVGNDIIAWTEIEYDPRWPGRNYSVIKIYDIHSGKARSISGKSRYSSSGISPDGKRIVTLQVTTDLQYNLLILNAMDGTTEEKIPNPGNYFFLTPSFSSDGTKIVAIRKSGDGKSLWVYDTVSKKDEIIYGPVQENIGNPYMYLNYIFYNSPRTGIDNIYAYNMLDKSISQVISRKYGSYNAFVSSDGTKIIFNDFSRDGMDIAQIKFSPQEWKPVNEINENPVEYYKPVVNQELTGNVFNEVSQEKYKVSKANRFLGLFNPYGWGPYITGTNLNLQIGIRMQDILSTSIINAGYEFNANENSGRWMASISYQGIYPVINFSAYSGKRTVQQSFEIANNNMVRDTTVNVRWKESGFNGGIMFPFNLTHSKYIENFFLSANAGFNNVWDYSYDLRPFNQQANGNLFYNTYRVQYNRQLMRSKRDINSRFAQIIYIQYDYTPLSSDYTGKMLSGEGRFIFPGIIKHHSLNLRLGFVNQDLSRNKGSYWFSSPVYYPRGYGYKAYEHFWIGSANYLLPLAYPDLHIGPLLNIQRIYTNIFVDRGIGETEGTYNYMTSTGMEVYFDFNLMRYLPLFNAGFRYAYVPELNSGVFQFLIGNFGL